MGETERYLGSETFTAPCNRDILPGKPPLRHGTDNGLAHTREGFTRNWRRWDQYIGVDLYFGYFLHEVC